MSGDKRARFKQWLESGEARLSPLSFSQRELWEASAIPVAAPENHICCLIHVRGAITPADCEGALRRVMSRQEVLRLSFLPGKDGPLQMVRESSDLCFRYRELSATEATDPAIEEAATAVFRRPFDLLQGPLYRLEMLQRSPTELVLVFAIHHAIADGWTLGVFVQDLCAAYLQGKMGVGGSLPPVPQSYSSWAAAERHLWQPDQLARCADYWKTRLAGTSRIFGDADSGQSGSGLRREIEHWGADLAKAAKDVARQQGATLFNILLAAFQIALSRWAGTEDIVVGTPVANRGVPTVRETMGYCAGNVPLRGQVEPAQTFANSLRRLTEDTLAAFAHAMPFVEVLRTVGDAPAPGHHPIYQVRFALQNHPIPDVNLPALSARLQMRSTGTARFDLGCEVTELGSELEVVWLFRADRFSQPEIEDLKRLFQTVLVAACHSPASRIAALAI